MKKLFLPIAVALSAATPVAVHAQNAAQAQVSDTQHALAREVVDNGFPPETRIDSMLGIADQMMAQVLAGNPQIDADPRLRAVMEGYRASVMDTTRTVLQAHMTSLMDGMVTAYAERFSPTELQALRDFVTSPEGYGLLTRMSDITNHPAYAQANQRYIDEFMTHMPQLQRELQQALVQAMSKDDTGE